MRYGIGIDTGGTYTDAVLYSFEDKSILHAAKALTTRQDLSLGIGRALDGLPRELVQQAGLVSLSTTLATNACVEDKGGRAKLIFIGLYPKTVEELGPSYGLPPAGEIAFLEGGSSMHGEVDEPNWEVLLDDKKDWFSDAEAVGVVELLAMKNPAVEQKAKALVAERFHLPVFCGHELFSDLNSLQRGAGTLLNARLIPVIESFLNAIKQALSSRGITAPVVIVRSDGSLMSEGFTTVRPVETLLCGPAASVMGGIVLSGEQDCIVVDMGGTTTDIALVQDGVPLKAEDGVTVGKWRTYVKGVYIHTFGLGGDSIIGYDNWGRMTLGPQRAIPLCIAASQWPSVKADLSKLITSKKQSSFPLHAFFMLIRDISHNPGYSAIERDFCHALADGPLSYEDAAAAISCDVYNFDMSRLEKEGVVSRIGLTPTDIMHIRGDFTRFDAEAAHLGAAYVAACLDVSPEALVEMVYDWVKERLYSAIVTMLLEDKIPTLKQAGNGEGLEKLLQESWALAKAPGHKGFVDIRLTTPAALVGIGAPIHIFLPDVARALGTRCVIPPHADVANALGAIVGHISATRETEVRFEYDEYGVGIYTVFGGSRVHHTSEEGEAIRIAREEAASSAREEVIRRGAMGDITVTTTHEVRNAQARGGIDICLGIRARATAVGGVSL